MQATIFAWLRYLSRISGFDSATAFPAGHAYARTCWNPAYFDIASDLKPEQIERRLCDAISNTPTVFGYITNPTIRMQRALFGVFDERARRNGNLSELVLMLINAYRSPNILEAIPGLRAVIDDCEHEETGPRVRTIMAFLTQMQAPFDVIELL